LVALICIEDGSPTLAKGLSEHPLFTGIATTLIWSLVAVGGFQAFRVHWEAERWRRLSSLAMMSIAYDINHLVDVFIWLIIGVKPLPTSSYVPTDGAHSVLNSIRLMVLEGETHTDDTDFSHVQSERYEKDLVSLAVNREWLMLANAEIDRAKVHQRRSIALWVPAMMLHQNATKVLARVVDLNDFMSDVQGSLRDQLVCQSPETRDVLVDRWTQFMAEAVSLREDLRATSRGRENVLQESRKILPPKIQEEMKGRDDEQIHKVVAKPLRTPPSRRGERA
jgi:hypothetical protein